MTAKDLKNALLQEAVQGKLVPQIASEGNARDLLEEIRKEVKQLDIILISDDYYKIRDISNKISEIKSKIKAYREKPLIRYIYGRQFNMIYNHLKKKEKRL